MNRYTVDILTRQAMKVPHTLTVCLYFTGDPQLTGLEKRFEAQRYYFERFTYFQCPLSIH